MGSFRAEALDHPMEDRFDAPGFAAGLQAAGLHVVAQKTLGEQAAWFVANKG